MSEPARSERTHRDGVRAVAPLAIAVVGFGVSFGVLARAAGMGIARPDRDVDDHVRRLGAVRGGLDPRGPGAPSRPRSRPPLLLNARYGPIGVSVAPSLTGSWWSRFLHAQLTVDETWAVAAEGDGRFNPRVLLGAGVTLYAAWVGGTVLGVAFGDVIGDPSTWGLDAAFPALFLALLVPQLRIGGRSARRCSARPSRSRSRRSRRPACRSSPRAPRACWGSERSTGDGTGRGAGVVSDTLDRWSSSVSVITVAHQGARPDAARGKPLPPRIGDVVGAARSGAARGARRGEHARWRPRARDRRPASRRARRRRRDQAQGARADRGRHRGARHRGRRAPPPGRLRADDPLP